MDTLQILDGSGHVTLTWDPHNPEDLTQARKAVEDLKTKGYSFFAVLNKDEVATGNGRLLVERIDSPFDEEPPYPVDSAVALSALSAPNAPEPAAIADPPAEMETTAEQPPRRGRGRPPRDIVATKPMRGGSEPEARGEILPPHSYILRERAGTAELPTGERYELSTGATTGQPIVKSERSGRWYTLQWPAIIDMAREAGIDDAS